MSNKELKGLEINPPIIPPSVDRRFTRPRDEIKRKNEPKICGIAKSLSCSRRNDTANSRNTIGSR